MLGITDFQLILLCFTIVGVPANLYTEYSKAIYPNLDSHKSAQKAAVLTIIASFTWYVYALTSGQWFFIVSTGLNLCFQVTIRCLKMIQDTREKHEHMRRRGIWEFVSNDYTTC